MASKYAEVGVDVKKRGIEVFKPLIDNFSPGAFCVIIKDPDFPEHGLVLHIDGAGSKPVQSYLHWRETGDAAWFKGLTQDVLAMNIDDVLCVRANPICFVDYIAVNPLKVSKGDLLGAIDGGFRECLEVLRGQGLSLLFAGGETADLADQLRTLDVSGALLGRVRLSDVVTGEAIEPGDLIVGLRSGGRTKYEKVENSGIMCNGITLARHCLMKREYEQRYPELRGPEGRGYYGRFTLDDYVDELGMTVGEAILSPTRMFAPVIAKILEKYGSHVKGMVHNTGGGQTKCLRIGNNVHYVKDDPLAVEPVFRLIQQECKEDWQRMYEVFNMGIGFEVLVEEEHAEDVVSISEGFGLDAQVVGRCERSDGKNRLTIHSPFGKFRYP